MRRMLLVPGAAIAVVFAGCSMASGGQSVAPEFEYQAGFDRPETGAAIAVLQPEIHWASEPMPHVDKQAPPFARLASVHRAGAPFRVRRTAAPGHHFQQAFARHYGSRLQDELAQGISELFAKHGFASIGTFEDYESLSAEQRHRALALSAFQTTLSVSDALKSRKCNQYRCIRRGTIQVDAQIFVQIVEPTKGLTAAYQRTFVYGFKVREPYVLEKAVPTAGAWATIKRWLTPDPALRDTTDEALARLASQLYDKAISSVDHLVTRRHLLALNTIREQTRRKRR